MQFTTVLPMEIIVEVLVQGAFDWKDLLNIRKTCKVLREASMARDVWTSLIVGYLKPTTSAPRRLTLERPLGHYGSQELEDMILQFHRAQLRLDGRQTKITPMVHDKTFPLPEKGNIDQFRLVPGGRWLLAIMPEHRLGYFDLDAADTKPVALTPPAYHEPADQGQDDQWAWVRRKNRSFTWDIDQDKSFDVLTLNVCMVVGVSEEGFFDWQQEDSRVDIWRIQLSVGQNRSESASDWRAERIATFSLDQMFIGPRLVSIFGRQFAYRFKYMDKDYLATVNWDQPGSSGSLSYSRRYMEIEKDLELDLSPMHFQLLSNEYVFTVINGVVSLVSLKDSPLETGPPTANTSSGEAIWRHTTLDLPNFKVSAPFFCAGSTRFIITGRMVVYGVIIPNARPKRHKFVLLAYRQTVPHFNSFLSTLGYYRTIANDGDERSIELFNFKWPEQVDTNGRTGWRTRFKLTNRPDNSRIPESITMDEQSGRMTARNLSANSVDVYSVA